MSSQKNSTLRVLHVVPGLNFGGGERSALELALALRKMRELDVRFCVLGPFQPAMAALAAEMPIDFLGWRGSMRKLPDTWRCVRGLRSLIQETDAGVLHTHMWPAAFLGAVAAAGKSIVHVSHVRDTRPWLASSHWRSKVHRLLARILLNRRNTQFIAVSQGASDYTSRWLPWTAKKLSTICNGIDLQRFREPSVARLPGRRNGRLVIGTVGRMVPEKGHEYLLRAGAVLRRRDMDVVLRLAGTGGLLPRLRELAEELGIAHHVRFEGHVEDIGAFYREIDALVLPSTGCEGLPRCVMEAMASGTPIVATTVEGNAEAIRDGQDGLLVPPADPEAIASAIETLACDSAARRLMGKVARERALELYDVHRVADEVARKYWQIMRDKHVLPGAVDTNRLPR